MSKNNRAKVVRAPEDFGYVRVSTASQNTDRQLIALEPYGIPEGNIFIEKKSGKDFNRPRYKAMLRKLRAGDLLYIKSIDRLGRNYDEIIEQWYYLTRNKGIDIFVLDFPLLDTRRKEHDLTGTLITDLILSVLSYVAQMERDNTLQRQAEGIAAAKAKGVVFGRKPVELPEDFDEIFRRWQDREITNVEAAKLCKFSVRTLYTLTEEMRRT